MSARRFPGGLAYIDAHRLIEHSVIIEFFFNFFTDSMLVIDYNLILIFKN